MDFSAFVYFVLRRLARIIMRVFFSLEYDGLHYLKDQPGAVILAGNHTGWLDTLALGSACNRRIRFLAAEWVTKWPIIGPMIVALGGIPVRPGKGTHALEEAVECLRRGETVCIFPEGVLSVDGNLAQFRSGVAKLHKESGCPVIPFAIYGGYEAWPYNRRWPRLHKIAIHFGVPLSKLDSSLSDATDELEDMVGFMKASLDRRYHSEAEEKTSFLSLLQAKSDGFSARPAVSMKTKNGWYELSYAELSRQAIRLSSYLIELGINQGDRIAILSESRPEFAVCFFGCIRAGSTIVPLDTKLTSYELKTLLTDCCPKALFISSHSLKVFEEIKESLDSNLHCFLIDHDPQSKNTSAENTGTAAEWHVGADCIRPFINGSMQSTPTTIRPYNSPNPPLQCMYSLTPSKKLPSRERSAEEVAVLIYTSGTTGSPKGVMTTVGNLFFQATQFEKLVNPKEGDRFLSILPLNHLLELTHGFLGVLHAGGTIYYSQSLYPKDIIGLMKEKRIMGMIAVPLFYRTLKNGIEREIVKGGLLKKIWWQVATATGAAIKNQYWRRFIFAPLHKSLGGRLQLLVSGGAPLELSSAEFFDLIGISILQGYGLTETSPVITCNTPSANRLGSVGPPIPGVQVKIEGNGSHYQEGEILTRGPHIMKGYFKRDDLTAAAIDKEGWFHTGDLGKIDKDGYLYVTGRIKNLIVLGGGKKVHPEEVEAVLAASPHVKEMCVLGLVAKSGTKEGTEEVCAAVVPTDTFKNEFSDDAQMEKALTSELQDLSVQLSAYKRPTRIIIMDIDLPKTATRKVKRNELVNLINSKS